MDTRIAQLLCAVISLFLPLICAVLTALAPGVHYNCHTFPLICKQKVDFRMSLPYWFDSSEFNTLDTDVQVVKAHVVIFTAELILVLIGVGVTILRAARCREGPKEGKMDLCVTIFAAILAFGACVGEAFFAMGWYMYEDYRNSIIVDGWYVSTAGLAILALFHVADSLFTCLR